MVCLEIKILKKIYTRSHAAARATDRRGCNDFSGWARRDRANLRPAQTLPGPIGRGPSPAWALHGADERVVRPEESRRPVAAVARASGEAKATIDRGVGRDAWAIARANTGFSERL